MRLGWGPTRGAVLGAGLMALLVGGLVPVVPAEAAHPGDENGRIVFSRLECCVNGSEEYSTVRSANPDGSDQLYLGRGAQPTWSPDGTRIAFVEDGSIIRTMNADGSDSTLVIGGSHPAWSPDGTHIAYTRDREIWVVAADRSSRRRLTTWPGGDGDSYPTWSQDGSRVAFIRFLEGGIDNEPSIWEIFEVPAAGGSPTQVTDIQSEGRLARLSYSPDGRFLLFDRVVNGWRDVVIADAATGEVVATPTSGGIVWGASQEFWPAWSPNGQRLVFYSTRSGGDDQPMLWTTTIDGLAPQRVTNTKAEDAYPDWQPRLARRTTTTDTVADEPDQTSDDDPPADEPGAGDGSGGATTPRAGTDDPTEIGPASDNPSRAVLEIDRAIARPGEVVLVRGSNFHAEVVTLRWSQGLGEATATPNSAGAFSVQMLVFPKDALGQRHLQAYFDATGPVAADTLTVQAPTLQPGGFSTASFHSRS